MKLILVQYCRTNGYKVICRELTLDFMHDDRSMKDFFLPTPKICLSEPTRDLMDDLQTVVGVSKDRCEFLGSNC